MPIDRSTIVDLKSHFEECKSLSEVSEAISENKEYARGRTDSEKSILRSIDIALKEPQEIDELLGRCYDLIHSATHWTKGYTVTGTSETENRNKFIEECKAVGRDIQKALEKE